MYENNGNVVSKIKNHSYTLEDAFAKIYLEKKVLEFVSSCNPHLEAFFSNLQQSTFHKNNNSFQSLLSDKRALRNIHDFEKTLSDFSKAQLYDYLINEFCKDTSIQDLVNNKPFLSILLSAWIYAKNLARSPFEIKLPQYYQKFIEEFLNGGDSYAAYKNLNCENTEYQHLIDSLCFLTGVKSFKDAYRKYIVLNSQSEMRDNAMLNDYHKVCAVFFKEYVEAKEKSPYDIDYAKIITQGFARYIWELNKDNPDCALRKIYQIAKQYNLDTQFVENLRNYDKLSKIEKFNLIYEYKKALSYYRLKINNL